MFQYSHQFLSTLFVLLPFLVSSCVDQHRIDSQLESKSATAIGDLPNLYNAPYDEWVKNLPPNMQQIGLESSSNAELIYDRNFFFFTPSAYKKDSSLKRPLLIVLHGGGGDASFTEKTTELSKTAERDGFFLAYGQGYPVRPADRLQVEYPLLYKALLRKPDSQKYKEATHVYRTWYADNCCGTSLDLHPKQDDSAYVSALIDKVSKNFPIADKKIFLAGMSNGGMATFKIGCQLSDRLAGIIPVVAAMNTFTCEPKQQLHVVMINGKADEHVLFEGGPPLQTADKQHQRSDRPVSFAIDFWTEVNACQSKQIAVSGNIETTDYQCRDGASVQLIAIENGTHAWPGGNKIRPDADTPTQEISANEVIAELIRDKEKIPAAAEPSSVDWSKAPPLFNE